MKIHLKGQLFKDIAEIQVDCSGAGQRHGMRVSAMPPAMEEVLSHCINSKGDNTAPKFFYCHSPENFDWNFLRAVLLDLKST